MRSRKLYSKKCDASESPGHEGPLVWSVNKCDVRRERNMKDENRKRYAPAFILFFIIKSRDVLKDSSFVEARIACDVQLAIATATTATRATVARHLRQIRQQLDAISYRS
ncbi:hypothetical protein DICVIV_08227 [Dictyocaulus viviparus]|uniref:Uncharacterized protein n=1 Tax=Dictyocaulus viviparus TaxID=29172 RepID=A0A0D8XMH7_DICVI|nr:hypothetical protein DICVIV_08227 [Dictyocaulus viviparus]